MRPTQSFTQSFFGALLIAGLVVMTGVVCQAQTSVALGVYGAFNGTTSGDGTQQSPANQAGGLFEFRQIKNPLVGYEATYSYNRGDQGFSNFPLPPCPTSGCTVSTAVHCRQCARSDGRLGCVASRREPATLCACRWRASAERAQRRHGDHHDLWHDEPALQPEHNGCHDPHLNRRHFFLRGWPGLGIVAASWPAFSVPRQCVQSTGDCQCFFVHQRFHP